MASRSRQGQRSTTGASAAADAQRAYWSASSAAASSFRARRRCTRRRRAAQGIAYVYRLLDVDRMGRTRRAWPPFWRYAEYFGFDGLNVTFPYKQEIIPLLDELSSEAPQRSVR